MSLAGRGRIRLARRFAAALAILCLLALSAAAATPAAAKPGPWIELGSGSQGNFLWSPSNPTGD